MEAGIFYVRLISVRLPKRVLSFAAGGKDPDRLTGVSSGYGGKSGTIGMT